MQVGMLPARGSLETYKGLFRGTPASQSSFNTPLWGKHSGNKALNQPTPGPATRPECPHHPPQHLRHSGGAGGSGTVRRGGT